MLLDSVRNLLGLFVATPPPPPPATPQPEQSLRLEPAQEEEGDDPIWPSARIAVAEAVWGEGFLLPGGGEEITRLARPFGLSAASSLLLIGAGTGGPPRRITEELGVWVTGYEANPRLAALANERSQRAGLGRRAQIESWDRVRPKFPPRYFHHGMAVEPLRGEPPEQLLGAVARALKPGGQFVLQEVVADQPLAPADPVVETWTRLDHRAATVPSEIAVTDALAQLGFDVRIVEDMSDRQMRQAIQQWGVALKIIQGPHPPLRQAALVVREAELWWARCRLMRSGRLRLVRWQAIFGA
jgi:SAM-dependent methyltransferase